MKKIINYSIFITFILGVIFSFVYPFNISNYNFLINVFSFKTFLYIFILSIMFIIIPFLSVNFSLIFLSFESFSFGYIIILFFKNFGYKGIIFILLFTLIFKLINYFILYLISFYSFKLIKHIYLNIFSKYRRNINNLHLYMKKISIMSIIFFIFNIALLICSNFIIPYLKNLL